MIFIEELKILNCNFITPICFRSSYLIFLEPVAAPWAGFEMQIMSMAMGLDFLSGKQSKIASIIFP